ncbi:uncharacterized protein LOC102083117 [Oreochromis niloticus]|uniref:uncharacterized protein LOC102083117 n=1 Tax=Oreochromis niloticus TaxID=8128 RepID=UPI000DF44423|nr:uncharacterized protein LOC102083117 [Oreochromis niloticus]
METNFVYCLLCKKPQNCIQTHLRKVCLKDCTPQEREEEASRAIDSQKLFGNEGRVWNFTELQEYCKDEEACIKLCTRLQSRGFLITNSPQACPTVVPTARPDKKKILAVAMKDIDYFHARLSGGDSIPTFAMTTFRQYCEAILILQHGLTANAVQQLSVEEWMARKAVTDGAELSSTAFSGNLMITSQEEQLLDCYFRNIRAVSLQNQVAGSDDRGKFFLGECGVPLSNPSLDVKRLRARYLSTEPEDAMAESASSSVGGLQTPGQASTSSTHRPLQEWDAFLQAFPVTLNGEPPSKRQCVQAGFPQHRHHYKKWRDIQLKKRVGYILGQSVGRRGNPPQPARVQMALDKEKWHTNKPTVNAILQAWVAPQPSIQDNESLMSSIAEQKWKGLALQDFGERKGKGVIALMPFHKGDIVCDYHGTYISEAEGKRRPQSGYLFFFRDECDRGMCIDATAFPCACHPDIETYGRRMNHSRKNPNIKPQKFTMNFPAGPQETILFIALKDITVGEELLWDYGVTRKSYGGEGEDLEWLDS